MYETNLVIFINIIKIVNVGKILNFVHKLQNCWLKWFCCFALLMQIKVFNVILQITPFWVYMYICMCWSKKRNLLQLLSVNIAWNFVSVYIFVIYFLQALWIREKKILLLLLSLFIVKCNSNMHIILQQKITIVSYSMFTIQNSIARPTSKKVI